MAKTTSPVSGVAERYARSLFELAQSDGTIGAVEADLGRIETMIGESADLARLVSSPVFASADQLNAISAVLDRAGISGIVANFVRVVTKNRRLFLLPQMIRAYRVIAADQRGEVAADVVSAHALTPAQQDELKATLKRVAGKDVKIGLTVDPSLLGGMIVRMGSRQIDTSLKTKLSSLKLALKEVG